MPTTFRDKLDVLLRENKPKRVLDSIFEAFSAYRKENPGKEEEIRDLKNELTILSARLEDLRTKAASAQLYKDEIEVTRSKLYNNLLGIIDRIPQYEDFYHYLSTTQAKDPENSEPEDITPPSPMPMGAAAPAYSKPTPPKPAATPTPPRKRNLTPVLGGIAGGAVLLIVALVFFLPNKSEPLSSAGDTSKQGKVTTPAVAGPSVEQDEAAWKVASRKNTVDAYEMYLVMFPDGKYAAQANKQVKTDNEAIETKLWNQAKSLHTIEGYEQYLRHSPLHTHAQEAETAIKGLLQAADLSNTYREAVALLDNSHIPLATKIEEINRFFNKLSTEDRNKLKPRLAELTKIYASYASVDVSDPNKFVTAKGVHPTKLIPQSPSKEFTDPTVYVFTQIRAPKDNELLHLIWYNENGQDIKLQAVTVGQNTHPGYRIYKSARMPKPGNYEVRLYNSQNILIATRSFKVIG